MGDAKAGGDDRGSDDRGSDDSPDTGASGVVEGAQPGVGALDLSAVLQSAMQMGEQIRQASARAAETDVEGRAAGGLVRVRVTGDLQFRSVEISEEAYAQGDREMLEDLVLAAIRDAVARVNELQRQTMGVIDVDGILGAFGALPGAEPGRGLFESADPPDGAGSLDTPDGPSADEVG